MWRGDVSLYLDHAISGIGHSLAKHKQVIIYPDKMKPFDQCFHFSHVNSLCRYVDLPGGCGIFAAVVDAKALGRIFRVSTDVYCRYYTCYISIRHIIHLYTLYLHTTIQLIFSHVSHVFVWILLTLCTVFFCLSLLQ